MFVKLTTRRIESYVGLSSLLATMQSLVLFLPAFYPHSSTDVSSSDFIPVCSGKKEYYQCSCKRRLKGLRNIFIFVSYTESVNQEKEDSIAEDRTDCADKITTLAFRSVSSGTSKRLNLCLYMVFKRTIASFC